MKGGPKHSMDKKTSLQWPLIVIGFSFAILTALALPLSSYSLINESEETRFVGHDVPEVANLEVTKQKNKQHNDYSFLQDSFKQQEGLKVAKLKRFLETHTKEKDPYKMAYILVKNSKRPEIMAAIGYVESEFKDGAVGTSGERGKWQLMSFWRPKGYNQFDDKQNLSLAEKVFDDAFVSSGGNQEGAIRRYNGSGEKTYTYLKKVQKALKLIESTSTTI